MQYMVDDTRVMRVSKRRKNRHVARRILFAAACLLAVVCITVVAVPSARAAVEEWINDWFSARDYFGQEKSERTDEPTIEAITSSANNKNVNVSSVGTGYEAYATAFDMTLDEIAYDGTSIFLSGTMSGATARPFVQAYTGGDTFRAAPFDGSLGGDGSWEYYYFSCDNRVTFETPNGKEFSGELVPTFTPEMDEICAALSSEEMQDVFENGELVTSNPKADRLWDAYLANHDVRFSMQLDCYEPEAKPLSGQVTGELSIHMRYDNVDSKDPVQVLSASFGDIVFDADAYQAQTQTTQAKSETRVDFGGTHPVTILEWQPEEERTGDTAEVYYYTHELDFTGASYSLKEISFTPTDTKITLHIVLPESWTAAERCYCDLSFRFLLDGEAPESWSGCPFNAYGPMGTADKTGKKLEYDFELFSSSLSPSQWANIKTLTILPMTTYWWDMKVAVDDGPQQDISLRDGAVYTEIVYDSSKPNGHSTAFQTDPQYDVMSQYALTINLDDYR
ncbi:MAG: DUF4179 domain-containing protein [Eubacteriales bacterium]|nr:DUF4179 domain-containing protein [Eubacteriales bacterium]